MSKETKEKIRQAHLGFHHSEESKLKMSKTRQNHFVSEETKLKISTAEKGKIVSEETRQKMRKPKSAEHRQHLSEARKGKEPWNKGKKLRKETI